MSVGQVIFFALFIITILAGAFVYFSPTQKAINSIKYERSAKDADTFDPDETLTRTRDMKVDMKTNGGTFQILNEIDDLSQEQKEFTDMISEEQEALRNAKYEINTIANKAVKNDNDFLKIKALGTQMQNEEELMVANGKQLTAVNDQLKKKRQMLTDQNDLVSMGNRSSLDSLKQHNSMVNDKVSMFVDKVSQQNNDAAQHSRDQQQDIRQHIADQQQRIRDLQNR